MKRSGPEDLGGQLTRALRLHECFKARRRGLTVEESAGILGVSRRQAYRTLYAMCEAGIPLYQDEVDADRSDEANVVWRLLRRKDEPPTSFRGHTVRERCAILGERVRRLREIRGLSLRGMQALSGIERENIRRLERGKSLVRFDTLCHIADALDVPLSKFFEGNHAPRAGMGEPQEGPVLRVRPRCVACGRPFDPVRPGAAACPDCGEAA